MDITDVKRLRPPGMVGTCSGPSGAPPVAPVTPWLSSCGASQYRTRGLIPGPRGSYCSISSRRWYLLEIVEARLHGEGLWVFFVRDFHVFATGGGCAGFIVHGKYWVVVCWGCLRFLFRPSFAPVRCSAIYRDIPTWVPRCWCYVSVIVERCNRYGRDG